VIHRISILALTFQELTNQLQLLRLGPWWITQHSKGQRKTACWGPKVNWNKTVYFNLNIWFLFTSLSYGWKSEWPLFLCVGGVWFCYFWGQGGHLKRFSESQKFAIWNVPGRKKWAMCDLYNCQQLLCHCLIRSHCPGLGPCGSMSQFQLWEWAVLCLSPGSRFSGGVSLTKVWATFLSLCSLISKMNIRCLLCWLFQRLREIR
jgi:hypothetical protein